MHLIVAAVMSLVPPRWKEEKEILVSKCFKLKCLQRVNSLSLV